MKRYLTVETTKSLKKIMVRYILRYLNRFESHAHQNVLRRALNESETH